LKAFNTEFAAIFTGDKADEKALFSKPTLGLGDKVVLEEYTFTHAGDAHAAVLNAAAEAFAALVANDPVWAQIAQRLVIVSDGMLSFFAKNACEVAQHVSIDDATGTAAEGKLFNQENVPSETLFYSVVTCFDGRGEFAKGKSAAKTADAAGAAFDAKLTAANYVFQFGGDASTGLGFCTVRLGPAEAAATNANAA
jgi:CRISPR-associated protein Cmr4